MEIIHNQSLEKSFSLNTIKGGKNYSGPLQTGDKELLIQLSEAFTIVNGGHFKKRRQIA